MPLLPGLKRLGVAWRRFQAAQEAQKRFWRPPRFPPSWGRLGVQEAQRALWGLYEGGAGQAQIAMVGGCFLFT
jgi:hypothetical protein